MFLTILSFSTLAWAADTVRYSAQAMLSIHNYYRCLHGTVPLTWNASLQASAEKWAAVRVPLNCSMVHSGYPGIGENIAAGTWLGLDGYNYWYTDFDVANGWYHEPWDYYNMSNDGANHFSQIVSDRTTTMGCAWVQCPIASWEFWVCQFYPPGNIYGQFQQNVPIPCRPSSDCVGVLKDYNLTMKYRDPPTETADLAPNKIPANFTYSPSSCQFAQSAYGQVVPGSSPNNTGADVGIAIAVILVVVLLVIAFAFYYRKKKQSYTPASTSPTGFSSPVKMEPTSATSPSNLASPSAVAVSPSAPPPQSPASPKQAYQGPWQKQYDESSKSYYYFNPKDGSTQWDKPAGFVE